MIVNVCASSISREQVVLYSNLDFIYAPLHLQTVYYSNYYYTDEDNSIKEKNCPNCNQNQPDSNTVPQKSAARFLQSKSSPVKTEVG